MYFLRTVTLEIERKITKYIYLKIISSKKKMQKASKRQKAKQRATGDRNKNPQSVVIKQLYSHTACNNIQPPLKARINGAIKNKETTN